MSKIPDDSKEGKEKSMESEDDENSMCSSPTPSADLINFQAGESSNDNLPEDDNTDVTQGVDSASGQEKRKVLDPIDESSPDSSAKTQNLVEWLNNVDMQKVINKLCEDFVSARNSDKSKESKSEFQVIKNTNPLSLVEKSSDQKELAVIGKFKKCSGNVQEVHKSSESIYPPVSDTFEAPSTPAVDLRIDSIKYGGITDGRFKLDALGKPSEAANSRDSHRTAENTEESIRIALNNALLNLQLAFIIQELKLPRPEENSVPLEKQTAGSKPSKMQDPRLLSCQRNVSESKESSDPIQTSPRNILSQPIEESDVVPICQQSAVSEQKTFKTEVRDLENMPDTTTSSAPVPDRSAYVTITVDMLKGALAGVNMAPLSDENSEQLNRAISKLNSLRPTDPRPSSSHVPTPMEAELGIRITPKPSKAVNDFVSAIIGEFKLTLGAFEKEFNSENMVDDSHQRSKYIDVSVPQTSENTLTVKNTESPRNAGKVSESPSLDVKRKTTTSEESDSEENYSRTHLCLADPVKYKDETLREENQSGISVENPSSEDNDTSNMKPEIELKEFKSTLKTPDKKESLEEKWQGSPPRRSPARRSPRSPYSKVGIIESPPDSRKAHYSKVGIREGPLDIPARNPSNEPDDIIIIRKTPDISPIKFNPSLDQTGGKNESDINARLTAILMGSPLRSSSDDIGKVSGSSADSPKSASKSPKFAETFPESTDLPESSIISVKKSAETPSERTEKSPQSEEVAESKIKPVEGDGESISSNKSEAVACESEEIPIPPETLNTIYFTEGSSESATSRPDSAAKSDANIEKGLDERRKQSEDSR